jgi:hypothetical protein
MDDVLYLITKRLDANVGHILPYDRRLLGQAKEEILRLRTALAETKAAYEQHVNDERSAVRTAMGLVENAARELPGPRADEWLQVLAVLKRAMEIDAEKAGDAV